MLSPVHYNSQVAKFKWSLYSIACILFNLSPLYNSHFWWFPARVTTIDSNVKISSLIGVTELGVKTFVAKIGKDNIPSRNLFEKKLQFHQVI